jgi:hypothetical protein
MDHPKTPEANASSIIHFLEKFYLMLNLLIENNPCIRDNTKLHRRIPFKSHPLKSIITNGTKDVVFSSSMLSKIASEKTRVTKKKNSMHYNLEVTKSDVIYPKNRSY